MIHGSRDTKEFCSPPLQHCRKDSHGFYHIGTGLIRNDMYVCNHDTAGISCGVFLQQRPGHAKSPDMTADTLSPQCPQDHFIMKGDDVHVYITGIGSDFLL